MAKTALANAKKASYIGKKVVIAVKAGGDDPSINRQLAAVMKEANSLDVTKDVVERNIKRNIISQKEYQEYLDSLEDSSEFAVDVETKFLRKVQAEQQNQKDS